MTHRWKETARSELQVARKRDAEAKEAKPSPLLESLSKAHEYFSSLNVRILQTTTPGNRIRVSEKDGNSVKTITFKEFLNLLHEIKVGTEITQFAPVTFHTMLEGFARAKLIVPEGKDSAESINNATSAMISWRSRVDPIIDLSGSALSAIGKALPDALLVDPNDARAMSRHLNQIKDVTDAYAAYQLLINISENVSLDELARIRSQSEEPANTNKRIEDLQLLISRYYSDLQIIHNSLCIFQDRLKELKQQNGQDDPKVKKDIKECHRLISQLRSEIAKLNERIIVATAERSGLLREKITMLFPRASAQLRAISEIPKTETAEFQDEPAETSTTEPTKSIERTPRETNDFMIAHLPRLYAMLMKSTDAEKAEGERIRNERNRKKELRRLERQLTKEGVPPHFISERINAGEKDVENILRQYVECKQTASVQPENVTGIAAILKFTSRTAKTASKSGISEKTLRHLVNQLVYARFGVRSADALEKTQRDMINKKMKEITAFLREYINYLNQPKGIRGAFMGRNDEVNTLFTEKFWIPTTNPGGWRAFSIQAGGEARIVLCVRPENEEISLFMAEPNHGIYTSTLARFNCERDISKPVVLSAENGTVSISIRNGSK